MTKLKAPEVAEYAPEPAKQMAAFLFAIDSGAPVPGTQWQRAARIAAQRYGYLAEDGLSLTEAGRDQLAEFYRPE